MIKYITEQVSSRRRSYAYGHMRFYLRHAAAWTDTDEDSYRYRLRSIADARKDYGKSYKEIFCMPYTGHYK